MNQWLNLSHRQSMFQPPRIFPAYLSSLPRPFHLSLRCLSHVNIAPAVKSESLLNPLYSTFMEIKYILVIFLRCYVETTNSNKRSWFRSSEIDILSSQQSPKPVVIKLLLPQSSLIPQMQSHPSGIHSDLTWFSLEKGPIQCQLALILERKLPWWVRPP